MMRDWIIGLAIVIAGCLIAASIYLAAGRDISGQPAVAPSAVKQEAVSQMKKLLVGERKISGSGRTLNEIVVTDLRYSPQQDRYLLEIETKWKPDFTVPASLILVNDGWGRYKGNGMVDQYPVSLLIK